MSAELPPYAFTHDIEVRFRDLDPMGHAHHSTPLVYFEEARAAFWRQITGSLHVSAIDYVLGELQVRYHNRIRYPETLRVHLTVTRVGNASFELGYEVRDQQQNLLVTGRSTQVMFDYDAGRSKPIPDQLRQKLSNLR